MVCGRRESFDRADQSATKLLSKEALTDPGRFEIYLATGLREERMTVNITGTEAFGSRPRIQCSTRQ